MWKRIASGIFFCFAVQSCYTVRLAFQQNNLINGRRPVQDVLQDVAVSDQVKEQLRYAEEVMAFAKTAGLNVEKAYRYYVALERDTISYTVEAAEPYELKAVTWWFPIVGNVPYLGFFEREEREAKAKELAAQGYDIARGSVGAFSSLGWFEDPIYSSMIRYEKADFAHLLFHELTHRTLWVRGSVSFNENLAEFVGGELTERFLIEKKWEDLSKAQKAKGRDRLKFNQWLKELREALEKFYARAASDPHLPLEQKQLAKTKIFKEFQNSPILRSFETHEFDYVSKEPWNNARVLGASLYSPDEALFQKALGCFGNPDIGKFLAALDERIRKTSDPMDALNGFCGSKSP